MCTLSCSCADIDESSDFGTLLPFDDDDDDNDENSGSSDTRDEAARPAAAPATTAHTVT